MKHINGLAEKLADVILPVTRSVLPQKRKTAAPERNKVVGDPARAPINRQAALAIAPSRCWLHLPPPEPPRILDSQRVAELEAKLKTARNLNGVISAKLHNAVATAKLLREQNERLETFITNQNALILNLRNELSGYERKLKMVEPLLNRI